jgi:L-lactate dehydrogenase complex protein LldF
MTLFETRVRHALQNSGLQKALAFATKQARTNRAAAFSWLDAQGLQPESMRERGHEIKMEVLADLDKWLDRLETKVKANGGQVYRAATAEDACARILTLAREHGVRSVVKSKSMATEEIDLNERFEAAGLEVLETDLGEYIVQLAKERPSHIIAPAIHKSRWDVAKLFHDVFHTDDRLSPAQLTAIAREKLREKFLKADLGVTGANFAIADTGTIVIVENEGNARLTTTIPRLHIAVMGIEKVIRSWSDLATLLPLLPPSGTGQKITSYVSMINGPRRSGETDGPEEFHLILIDNGRRRIHEDPVLREALACLRCGACLNACPVYGHIGGHAYGWVYPGPIGAVIAPALRGIDVAGELPFASSLCGACLDACPVKIDIPKMLVHLRAKVNRTRPPYERWAFRAWSVVARRPALYRRLAPLGRRYASRFFPAVKAPQQSFVEQWKQSKHLK